MLVLTRTVGEAVVIGQDITVTVVAVDGERVRLGIEAPREVPVHREEVAERIARELTSCAARESLDARIAASDDQDDRFSPSPRPVEETRVHTAAPQCRNYETYFDEPCCGLVQGLDFMPKFLLLTWPSAIYGRFLVHENPC